jgi:hypothetical protein
MPTSYLYLPRWTDVQSGQVRRVPVPSVGYLVYRSSTALLSCFLSACSRGEAALDKFGVFAEPESRLRRLRLLGFKMGAEFWLFLLSNEASEANEAASKSLPGDDIL